MTMTDRQYRWVVVSYSLVIQAVSIGILIYCFALFALPWLDAFDASRRDVMITISCLQIGAGVFSPLLGRFMDQYPMRWIVIAGAIVLSLGLYLTQLATALWQIWIIYATLMPIAIGLTGTLASQTLVTKWFTEERGLALGISAMGTSIGGIVFPWVVAGMLTDIGWREAFVYLSITCIVIIVPLSLLVLRRNPQAAQPELADEPTSNSVESKFDTMNNRQWSNREILTASLFWLPFLAMCPLLMSFGALQANLGVLARDMGLADSEAASLIMISSFCMIIGKLFFGTLGDRWDHRFLFWTASLVMLASLVSLLTTSTYAGLVVCVICLGLAGGGIIPLLGLIFGARFGAASFGRVMGFVMLTGMFGAVAPVIAGSIYDMTQSYDWALWGLILMTGPAMLTMYWLPRAHRSE
jgi:MFS family permease